MSAKSIRTSGVSEDLMDDISNENVAESIDQDKLTALKAKLNKKESVKDMVEKKCSIRFGVIGLGQMGGRASGCFAKRGYDAIAINTAQQDLEHIELPEDNKLFLEYSLGGASKDRNIGEAASEAHKDSIEALIHKKLSKAQIFIIATSCGGGSGSGAIKTVLNILSTMGIPIIVMACLPMANEDVLTKSNSLETLAELVQYVKNKSIANLILIDNAKIEAIYNDVSQMNFYKVANEAIVDVIDQFNILSSTSSDVKSLDPMEFAKILTDSDGLTIYGKITVANYSEDIAIAEAIVESLSSNLLSSGFDLKKSKNVGVIITANKAVWDKIPSGSINYAMAMLNDVCGSPEGVFKGIYTVDSDENVVKIYSIFSGLSLPDARVEQLKKETQDLKQKNKEKNASRTLSLNVDTGVEETISATDKIKQQIAQKKSAFGKLTQNAVIDKRK